MKKNPITLNVGCGPDDWGDVRVDRGLTTQTGVPSKANIIADAHELPFRNLSFSDCRCFHVLEHCRSPKRVVSEIERVSQKATLRFPIGDITRNFVINLLNLDFVGLKHDFLTKKNHFHLWRIEPNPKNALRNSREVFQFLHRGRKARLFGSFRPRMSWEWEIVIWSGSETLEGKC